MSLFCSMHCGQLLGVDQDLVEKNKPFLDSTFTLIRYYEGEGRVELCGARDVNHDPDSISRIFDLLSTLLAPEGSGRVMVHCDGAMEICYFRKNMWKLMNVPVPSDPFEGIRHVE